MTMTVARIAKAVTATAVAALGTLEVASLDGHFTARELINVAIVSLTALGGVFAVPNSVTLALDEAERPVGDPNAQGAYPLIPSGEVPNNR
jgi:hypothetical protein